MSRIPPAGSKTDQAKAVAPENSTPAADWIGRRTPPKVDYYADAGRAVAPSKVEPVRDASVWGGHWGKPRSNRLEITFEYHGHFESVVIDVPPLENNAAHRGRFKTVAHTEGDFEVRNLDRGGLQYLLYIDGTGETVTLEGGETFVIRQGVIGFGLPENWETGAGRNFQSPIGRHLDKARTVRSTREEYHDFCRRLAFAEEDGFRQTDLSFLKDLVDIDLLQNAINYILNRSEFLRKPEVASRGTPILANPALSKDQQRRVLERMIHLAGDGPLSAVLGPLGYKERPSVDMVSRELDSNYTPTTLATLEVIFDLVQEYRGRMKVRAMELIKYLAPVKARAHLPGDKLMKAVEWALQGTRQSDPKVRAAAYKSLNAFLTTDDHSFNVEISGVCHKSLKFKSVETDRLAAAERIKFLGALNRIHKDRQHWTAMQSQLSRGPLSEETLKAGIEFLDNLEFDAKAYANEEVAFIRALLDQIKMFRITKTSMNPWDELAWKMVESDIYSWSGRPTRYALYTIVNAHYPEWTKKLSDKVKVRVDILVQKNQGAGDLVLSIDELKPTLGFNLEAVEQANIDNLYAPSQTVNDIIHKTKWKKEDQKKILTGLLKLVRRMVREKKGALNEWGHCAYYFAKNNGMLADFQKWLLEGWGAQDYPLLIQIFTLDTWNVDHDDLSTMSSPSLDANSRAHLTRYGRTLMGEDSLLRSEQGVKALRYLSLGPPPGDPSVREFAVRLIDVATGDVDVAVYPLFQRVEDINRLRKRRLIPTNRYEAVGRFFARALETEPFIPEALPAAQAFQTDLKQNRRPSHAVLDRALDRFMLYGQYPASTVVSADQIMEAMQHGLRGARLSAMQNAKFWLFNRETIERVMAGQTFNPRDLQQLQKLERAVVLGTHDHAEGVAKAARSTSAYARFFLLPKTESHSEIEPVMLVQNMPRAHEKARLGLVVMEMTGAVSQPSLDSVSEAFREMPRALTVPFFSVEGHTPDKQTEAAELEELVVKDGARRYVLKVYKDMSLETVIHALMHPLYDQLSEADRKKFRQLHAESLKDYDYAEPYGRSDDLEDWATLGQIWFKNSAEAMRDAVDYARSGHPLKLFKLLIILKALGRGADKMPGSYISFDKAVGLNRSDYSFEADVNGNITRISVDGNEYNFGYTDRGLKYLNGVDLTTITPYEPYRTTSEVPLHPVEYHPEK